MWKLVWGRFHKFATLLKPEILKNVQIFIFWFKEGNFEICFIVRTDLLCFILVISLNQINYITFGNRIFFLLSMSCGSVCHFTFVLFHSCNMKFPKNSAFILYYLVIFVMIVTRGPSQSHSDQWPHTHNAPNFIGVRKNCW